MYTGLFDDTATTEIYTLSLHDALPICLGTRRDALPRGGRRGALPAAARLARLRRPLRPLPAAHAAGRSEEHTSELQSRQYLVCRLLLEKHKSVPLRATAKALPTLAVDR